MGAAAAAAATATATATATAETTPVPKKKDKEDTNVDNQQTTTCATATTTTTTATSSPRPPQHDDALDATKSKTNKSNDDGLNKKDTTTLTKSQRQRRARNRTKVRDPAIIARCLTDPAFLPPPHLRAKQAFDIPDDLADALRQTIVDIFRSGSGDDDDDGRRDRDSLEQLLAHLHRQPGLDPAASNAGHRPAVKSPFHKAYKNVCCNRTGKPMLDDLKRRYNDLLKRLAREVLAPLLEVGSESVLYQAVPVLRVSHPSTKCMGKMHTDYVSNNHQPAELNFWIPLCRAFGNNTLYVESAPGVGDFVPIELSHGQGMRFWGNQVRHHAVVNDTDTTRVSLDLRAMAKHTFNADFVDRRGQPLQRRIGEFYLDSGV